MWVLRIFFRLDQFIAIIMNQKSKRYRQTSLIECFASSKKPKSDSSNMDETTSVKELFSVAGKKRVPSQSNFCDSVDVCQAAKDSNTEENVGVKELFSANGKKKMPSQSDFEDSMNVCEAAEDSVVIKSADSETEAETHELHQTNDSSKCSDDLFPSDPSLEDHTIPSSSHSAELFTDSEPQSQSTPEFNETAPDSDELDGMSLLNRKPDCSLPLPKLEPSANHSIMFSPHIRPGDAPRPYPSSYRDKWDSDHIRMPCSPLNKFPVVNSYGEKKIASRWDLICRSLRSDIGSSEELEAAIMKYNSQYIGKWNFQGLHGFINKHLSEEERDHFFEVILPGMIEMALKLPNICTQSIPTLKKNKDHYLTMSQKQIGCLLSNAFFCTFPRRPPLKKNDRKRWAHEYANYPDINFNRLFYGVKNRMPSKNIEKLKCLLNYFRRIISEEPSGTVTFHRQCIAEYKLPMWHTSDHGIRTAVIRSSGLIETEGHGMLQVDFANKFVGGGVLGQGCVQEEIRFVICPELIVSRLFVECLEHNEVLIVTGVEQYNKYSGYANSFKWAGDFRDQTPRDSWGRRYTEVLAMDATNFNETADQFKFHYLKRELNKAYSGFYNNALPEHLPAIATGNWGCGAFKGNPNLKFLIQLMAASEASRSLIYFTFGDKKLKTEIQKMYEFLNDKNLVVGDVWRLLMSYDDNINSSNTTKIPNLYDFIYSEFVSTGENSRQQNDGSSEDQYLDDSDKNALSKLFEDVDFGGSSTEIKDGT